MNKRLFHIISSLVLVALILSACSAFGTTGGAPIKVGVLHATSGTMAISESSVVDATLLAIEEINQKGGVLGRQIQPMVVDTKSDWNFAAQEAERLITQEQVSVVFGCWTSSCRKTVKPVFEQYKSLLFYPVQYEGLELSPNIVYTGAAPNQQITPAVKWSVDNLGSKFFLVGSDYVFPRTANAIIKDQVKALRGTIVGEEYIVLGSQDVSSMVQKIVEAQPDVILNTINGDSNVAFFKALQGAGITADKIPVVSFSIAEDELRTLGVGEMTGNYAAWNYFESIKSPENTAFVNAFKSKYGADRVTDDPMEAAYFGVHLWAQAAEAAGSPEAEAVLGTIGSQTYGAPEGVVAVDPETQHIWKTVRIGRIQANGQFNIVWTSNGPVRPVPYPVYRTPVAWDSFLNRLYQGWGGSWAKPGN
jgi:urea transport system substrate-binding protein